MDKENFSKPEQEQKEKIVIYDYDQLAIAYENNGDKPVELPEGMTWESAVMTAAVNEWWPIPENDPNTHKPILKRKMLIEMCMDLGVKTNFAQIPNIHALNKPNYNRRPPYEFDDSKGEGGWLLCRKPNSDKAFVIPADHDYFTDNASGFILIDLYGVGIRPNLKEERGFTFERMLRPCELEKTEMQQREGMVSGFKVIKPVYLKQPGLDLPENIEVQEGETMSAGVELKDEEEPTSTPTGRYIDSFNEILQSGDSQKKNFLKLETKGINKLTIEIKNIENNLQSNTLLPYKFGEHEHGNFILVQGQGAGQDAVILPGPRIAYANKTTTDSLREFYNIPSKEDIDSGRFFLGKIEEPCRVRIVNGQLVVEEKGKISFTASQ